MCFVIYQEQKNECDIHRARSIKTTALLTGAASLGWTSALTCCNILQGVLRTCVCIYIPGVYISPSFLFLLYRAYVDFARPITQIVFQLKRNQIKVSIAQFCLILLTCNNIMHIVPLPLSGLYSIRAQNGYGQHRPCEIVLLTLVAPRECCLLYTSPSPRDS